ncbi:MAG: transporter [Alphaproteobacteria bacterium]|nr:transporter [Alphaproteobacteria bacterium]
MNCGALGVALLLATAGAADGDQALRDLCPDRPGRGSSACTVDEGHFQIESDLVNATFDRQDGFTTDTIIFTDPNLKYGISNDFDVEANFTPYEIIRSHDSYSGASAVEKGIGDLYLRTKWAVIGNSGTDFALALDAFLKLPTAPRSIGNGAVEGGLVVPLSWSLGDGWSLGSTPEIDVLQDSSSTGYHPAVTDVFGLSKSIGSGVSLGAELWESTDFDRQMTTQQYSVDGNAAWIPESAPNWQLDAGANFGLNHNSHGTQLYSGVSRRF